MRDIIMRDIIMTKIDKEKMPIGSAELVGHLK